MNFPAAFPELATDRLRLRALDDGDADALFAIFSDARVMRYWSSPPWTERATAYALITRDRAAFAEQTALRWGVIERAGGSLVGTCSLFRLDAQNRRGEIGYALDAAHWGRGLMHETLVTVLDWAFGPLGLHRIEADVDPRNGPSVRSLERLGFAREGLLRERWIVAGETSDSLLLGLLAADWHARRADA